MSKTDYDKAMLPSWHSFEEYNLCAKGHVQQRLLRSCSQYLFCVYGRHYTNTKKNTRVKSTTYSGLCLIQMLLCTLHSADLRVELIKDADTLFELADFIPNQRKRKCHLCLHTGSQNPHPNKHTKKHALQTRTVESITSFYLTADSLRERTGHNGGYK